MKKNNNLIVNLKIEDPLSHSLLIKLKNGTIKEYDESIALIRRKLR